VRPLPLPPCFGHWCCCLRQLLRCPCVCCLISCYFWPLSSWHQPAAAPLLRRYFTLGAATAMLTFGLSARPDSSLTYWADRKAAEIKGSA